MHVTELIVSFPEILAHLLD